VSHLLTCAFPPVDHAYLPLPTEHEPAGLRVLGLRRRHRDLADVHGQLGDQRLRKYHIYWSRVPARMYDCVSSQIPSCNAQSLRPLTPSPPTIQTITSIAQWNTAACDQPISTPTFIVNGALGAKCPKATSFTGLAMNCAVNPATTGRQYTLTYRGNLPRNFLA
jgi:hypothetical protein